MMALTRGQMGFVSAMIRCNSVPEAAKAVNIAERTGWTWMALPEVKAELAQALGDVREHVIEELSGQVHDAVQVLAGLMNDRREKSEVRVSAARALLSTVVRLVATSPAADQAGGGRAEIVAWFERVGVKWRARTD